MGIASAIGGALSIGGALLGSKSANKAAKQAANVSAENNAANVALQREVYGKNQQTLAPFVNRGNAAGDALNALLGLGGGTQPQAQPQPNALSQFYGSPGAGYGVADGQAGLGTPFYAQDTFQSSELGPYRGTQFAGTTGFPQGGYATQAAQTGNVTVSPQQAQNAAFDNFRNSTGYQFRLGEGMNALNSGYAGAGVLQSGDALRAAQEYGQNFASNEFGNYTNLLANQQGVGLSGANALAGVGTNFAANVSRENTINAANQANAITSQQNPFANALSSIGGGLFGYGTGRL